MLPQFGAEGQVRVKRTTVLVIGAGGLGAPVLQYLAAAGVGRIFIADFDVVAASNLQRQVLFTESEINQPKAAVAAQKLQALNPHVEAIPVTERFSPANALKWVQEADLVLDGTDNFATRYLANDACVLAGKPLVYGSVVRYEGQVAVFNALLPDGSRSANYRDLYPAPPPLHQVPDCATGGVLGVLPGLIGCAMAAEALKLLAQIGEPLANRLWVFDALHFRSHVLAFDANPENPLTADKSFDPASFDYAAFCGQQVVPEITCDALQVLQASGKPVTLVDVRTAQERQGGHLGGQLMPYEAGEWKKLIGGSETVVLYCQSGQRSGRAVKWLTSNANLQEVFSLKGGINAWEKAGFGLQLD